MITLAKILNESSLITELVKNFSSPQIEENENERALLYSLIDAYAKERIDDLLKIGAADEIHDTIRALGQRAADLYAQNADESINECLYYSVFFLPHRSYGNLGRSVEAVDVDHPLVEARSHPL